MISSQSVSSTGDTADLGLASERGVQSFGTEPFTCGSQAVSC